METDLTEQCQGEAGQVPGGARRPQAMKVAGWRGGDFQWIEVAGLLFIWEIRSLKKLRRGASELQTVGWSAGLGTEGFVEVCTLSLDAQLRPPPCLECCSQIASAGRTGGVHSRDTGRTLEKWAWVPWGEAHQSTSTTHRHSLFRPPSWVWMNLPGSPELWGGNPTLERERTKQTKRRGKVLRKCHCGNQETVSEFTYHSRRVKRTRCIQKPRAGCRGTATFREMETDTRGPSANSAGWGNKSPGNISGNRIIIKTRKEKWN